MTATRLFKNIKGKQKAPWFYAVIITNYQTEPKENKSSEAEGNLCIAAKTLFKRKRGACILWSVWHNTATNKVPPCWPSSQLQLQLRLKIDNPRESSRESKAFWKIPQPSLIHPLQPFIRSRSFFFFSFVQNTLCILAVYWLSAGSCARSGTLIYLKSLFNEMLLFPRKSKS